MSTFKTATPAEIVEDRAMNIRNGWRVSYRHFMHERSCPSAKHGVKHITKTASKIVVKDGVPFVRYCGELVELTATWCTYSTDTGSHKCLVDFRIKSEYLKGEYDV